MKQSPQKNRIIKQLYEKQKYVFPWKSRESQRASLKQSNAIKLWEILQHCAFYTNLYIS